MFSGLAKYLFGSTNSDTFDRKEDDSNFKESVDNNQKPLTTDDNLKFLSIDDEDWLIVDKEEYESLPRTDSEEELPFVEIKKQQSPKNQRPRRHNRAGASGNNVNRHLTNPNYNDGISQALYVVPNNESNNTTLAVVACPNGQANIMEESWFLTPPPCFTSTGPVQMETSPFENLLIEHPSMSVYHSIRSAQEAAVESFIDLDLGAEESITEAQLNSFSTPIRNMMVIPRVSIHRTPEQHLADKKNYLLRNSQKNHDKKDQRQNCGAKFMKRGNKAREGKNSIKRDNCKNNGRQNYLWCAKQKC